MGSLCRDEDKLPTLSPTLSKLLEEVEEHSRTCLSVAVQGEATETDSCRTPTAQEHRIPKLLTCPPAPKKQRKVMPTSGRVEAEFFYTPDIDAMFALHQQVSTPKSFRL